MTATYRWLYEERYNHVTKRTVSPCSEEEARQAHEEGRLYTAVLWDVGADLGVSVIEIIAGRPYAHVMLFDPRGWLQLDYAFGADPKRPRELFLQKAIWAGVEGVGDEAREVQKDMYRYKLDGSIHHTVLDWEAHTETTRTGMREAWALEMNYEPVPAFGDYASLLRVERDLPVSEQPEGSASRIVAEGLVD